MTMQWLYARTPGMIAGTMQCTFCKKQINEGQFRYREGRSGFLTQHRACSADDPRWSKGDAEERRSVEFDTARRAAFATFVKQWGPVDDLVEDAAIAQQSQRKEA